MKITATDVRVCTGPAQMQEQDAEFFHSIGKHILNFAPDTLNIEARAIGGGDVERELATQFYVLTDADKEAILGLLDSQEAIDVATIIFAANRDVALESLAMRQVADVVEEADGVPING